MPKLPTTLRCKRCGHRWVPRVAHRPVQCPACHQGAWDRAPMRRVVDGIERALDRLDGKR